MASRRGRLRRPHRPASIPPVSSTVLGAVTTAQGVMQLTDLDDPGEPAPGEIVVRPEAVGICGSDFHYFLGDIGTIDDPSVLYPRVQGHEFSAVVDAVGPECPEHLRPGERVAVWPLLACGTCYPCRIGRANVCANISLIGVHQDGALQERLRVPATQAFPLGELQRDARRARGAVLDRGADAEAQSRGAGRAGGRPRRRPDRSGDHARRARSGRARPPGRPARAPGSPTRSPPARSCWRSALTTTWPPPSARGQAGTDPRS